MDERRSLLEARRKGSRPDHAQVAHVVAIDSIQRTVAPAVERPPPHEPVGGVGILQHLVRHRDEGTARLRQRLARRSRGEINDTWSDADWRIYCRLYPGQEPVLGPHLDVDSSGNIESAVEEVVKLLMQE